MNKSIITRNFSRAAARYEANARLQLRVAVELVSQCGVLCGNVLDIGAGPGIIAKNSMWEVVSLDISPEMCRLVTGAAVNADAENLPFHNTAFANAVSSLSLQWVSDLEKTFSEINRVLTSGGKFAFTTFAPDSLKNLRTAFTYLDGKQHLMEFEHAIRIFALLKKSGFGNIVMNSQKMSFNFPDILTALRSIKNIGASYNFKLSPGLKTKRYFAQLENIYKNITKSENQIPLEWEILYIQAEKT